MLRRKVETVSSAGSSTGPTAPRQASHLMRSARGGRGSRSGSSGLLRLWIIATLTIVLVMVSFMSPSTVKKAEEEAVETTKEVLHNAYVAEQQMEDWFHHQQKPPIPEAPEDRQASLDATEAMKRQPSSWVDGEKKLKQMLKPLVERQRQGKDVGVPILTRYLGEDFPAWVPEGGNVEEWTKKRDAKYDEMRKEEEKWKSQVRKYLEAHPETI